MTAPLESNVQAFGQFRSGVHFHFSIRRETLELGCDLAVVARRPRKSFPREIEPRREAHAARGFDLLRHAIVIRWIRDNRDALEILRR